MYTKIENAKDLSAALRSINKMDYTTMGGYPIVFVSADGGFARPSSVLSEYKSCLRDYQDRGSFIDRFVGMDVFWEGAPEEDVITGEPIDSAYGDPDVEE